MVRSVRRVTGDLPVWALVEEVWSDTALWGCLLKYLIVFIMLACWFIYSH